MYQFFILSIDSSIFNKFIFSGLISGVILHPAYFKAVIYRGSLIPISLSRLELNNSSGVISAAIIPESITIILSIDECNTSSNLCSIINIVLLLSFCI